jgi:predicted flap endonuclease-1-like 5' DNA nuclease
MKTMGRPWPQKALEHEAARHSRDNWRNTIFVGPKVDKTLAQMTIISPDQAAELEAWYAR